MTPKISVITPVLNEEKFIGQLIETLKSQSFQDYEFIVADAKSTDKTVEVAKKGGARVVPGGRTAMGRNSGAKNAKADILLFLDADVKFNKDFLKDSYENFTSLNLDMACCYFDIKPLSLKMKLIYQMWNSSKYIRRSSKTPDGEGQCIWMRKTVFDKVGGFNEMLRVAEDTDLIHRTVKKGFKYDVLHSYFVPSTRRYEQVGILRVFAGSLIGGLLQLFGVITDNKFSEVIYGGWGKHKG